MFKTQPMIYYAVPKHKYYILSGLATTFTMFSCAVIGLSIGTDHWREAKNPGHNTTVVIQGLVEECDRRILKIDCIQVTNSRFAAGHLGTIEIVYGLLIESLLLGLMSLLASFLASFHKKHILVTTVVAMEITSALFTMLAASIYTHNINEKPWRFGWSYGLAWLGFISMLFVPVFHYIVQDVKFLGKSICI
ncbi:lens fiber membrane intrinsic protein-like isoform X2 [Rhopilema esculentum]